MVLLVCPDLLWFYWFVMVFECSTDTSCFSGVVLVVYCLGSAHCCNYGTQQCRGREEGGSSRPLHFGEGVAYLLIACYTELSYSLSLWAPCVSMKGRDVSGTQLPNERHITLRMTPWMVVALLTTAP